MEIRNAVNAADTEAQYDEKAKRLLGNKIILAHILVKAVEEFRGMNPKDVVPYIEGEPFISVVPVEPGLTNVVEKQPDDSKLSVDSKLSGDSKLSDDSWKDGQRIVGLNTENTEINGGLSRLDIIFYVRMPSIGDSKGVLSQFIVNLEIQKDEPTSYHILNRAVFYVSRLISSQKERDFVKTNYNDIRRVYSIWVCLGMDENSMAHVHLVKDDMIGSYPWKGGLDLLNIVMIGIADELPEHDNQYELHRLLSALLSMEMAVEEKLGIIRDEYSIPVDDKLRREVGEMCNLSQGIREKAELDREEKIILNMHKIGYTSEQIAEAVEKSVDEVEAVIRKREPVLA